MTEEERPEPGSGGRTDDEVWEALVASFHASPDAPREPAPEERRPGSEKPAEPWVAEGDVPADAPSAGWRPHAPAPEPEEHFTPPTPPPAPPMEPVQRLAWIGTIGGPAVLLGATLLGWQAPSWVVAAAVAGFLGGFVTLVARMKRGDDQTDGDDGAVV